MRHAHPTTSLRPGPTAGAAKAHENRLLTVVQPTMTEYKLYGDLAIYSGTAHQELAQKVADYLGLAAGRR